MRFIIASLGMEANPGIVQRYVRILRKDNRELENSISVAKSEDKPEPRPARAGVLSAGSRANQFRMREPTTTSSG